MNILQINKFYYLKGGAERYYFNLSDLLVKRGLRVIPFAMEDIKNEPTPYKKYFVSPINIEKAGFSWQDVKAAGRILYSWEAQRKLKNLLADEKIDLAHIHNIYHQISPSILTVLKDKKIPIVMSVHDFKLLCPVYSFFTEGEVCERCKVNKFYNCVLHRCAKNSYAASKVNMVEMYLHRLLKIYRNNIDLYICPSEFVRNKLVEYGWPGKKIIVLPHFVNLGIKNLSSQAGEYALYFGRLIKEKGLMDLLKAYQYLKNDRLMIAGTGPHENIYKNFVKKNNLNNIEFVGYLAGENLTKAIRGAKYVMVPSRNYETFGLTIAESFAQGKTVIASDIGALPELVKHGQTGMLFKAGDWRDLKNKIIEIGKEPDRAQKMGENAKQFAEINLDSEQYYTKLITEYNKLI